MKSLYQQFVSLLNIAAQDSVQSNRERAIGSMLKLVLANRELEDVKNLFRSLVSVLKIEINSNCFLFTDVDL